MAQNVVLGQKNNETMDDEKGVRIKPLGGARCLVFLI